MHRSVRIYFLKNKMVACGTCDANGQLSASLMSECWGAALRGDDGRDCDPCFKRGRRHM